MREFRNAMALVAAALFFVALYFMHGFSYGSFYHEIGVGFFCGAASTVLGVVAKKAVDDNLGDLIRTDNPLLTAVDSLPFLALVPVVALITYASIVGNTSAYFNASAVLASVLFGLFFGRPLRTWIAEISGEVGIYRRC